MADINYENFSMESWLRLSDAEQQRIMREYIGAGRKPSAGNGKPKVIMKRQTRPTRREMDEQYDSAPAWPAGEPSDRWTEVELKAYSEAADRLVEQAGAD